MKEYKVIECSHVDWTLELPKDTIANVFSISTKAADKVAAFLKDKGISFSKEGNVILFSDDFTNIIYNQGVYKLVKTSLDFTVVEKK